MKSFFIKRQLQCCDSKISSWLEPFGTGIKLCVFTLLTFLLSLNVNAQLCPGSGPIFIDGNPADWPGALNNTANTRKAFTPDINSELNKGALDDGYTQGTSNNLPIEDWRWVYGQTNSKGDIENAGALLLGNKLYFFGDRSAFNGTCEIGFWFLLDRVAPTGTGGTPGSPFSGTHKNGDLMVLNTFTSGGGAATPKVFMWLGKTATAPGGLVELTNASSCSRTNETVTYNAPGGVSGITINIPPNGATTGTQEWKFDAKDVASERDPGKYYSPLFFEGVVDLGSIPGASPCFQSFIMKTTTSANNTAANVDLVAGEFSGIPDPPVVVGDEKCYGFAATATATCTGSTAQWYNPTTGALVHTGPSLTLQAGTAAGTYTYNVTCITTEGCESAPRAVSIVINPQPTVNGLVSEGENDNSVNDGVTKNSDDNYTMRISKTLTASLTASAAFGTAPYTYTWEELDADAYTSLDPTTGTSTGNATFAIASPPAAALRDAYRFRVTVVDSKGCTSTDELVINIDGSAPVCVINGADPVCAGSQNNIYTTNTPLNADFTYTWSISSTNGSTIDGGSPQAGQISQVSVDAGATAGSYTLTLSIVSGTGLVAANSPCTKTVQVILVAPTSSKTNVVCNGQSNGTMTAVGAGGTAPYSYTISPAGNPANTTGATSGAFTGLAAGTYTITATDVNNCSGTTTQTIGQPDALSCALIAPATLACGSSGTVTGTITGGTAGYTCSASFDAAGVAGGWRVTGCVVTGTGIAVSYTSGLSTTSAVLTVNVTDENGCTTSCSITVQCTGGQSCSPGFWKNQTQYWDDVNDVAVVNMPGTLTNPVTPGGTFITSTNFWAYFNLQVGTAGISNNPNLTMGVAIDHTNLNNVACKTVVFHGIANLLSSALLPNTFPFPAGSNGNFTGLYNLIRNALLANDCGPLGSTLGAISNLHTGNYCEVAANAGNSITSRDLRAPVVDDDGGLNVTAYPNPYNNVVNFKFASPATGKAVLDVYDILGRKLATVFKGEVKANVPMSAKYNVPTLSRVALYYKLTVDNKSIKGSVLPEK